MQINDYIYFSIAGLFYLILIIIIFFTKKRVKLRENNIYIALMFLTVLGIINEILMVYSVPFLEQHELLKGFVAKSFLILTETWVFLLSLYTVIISNNENDKNKTNTIIMLCILGMCFIATSILPINYAYNDTHTSWLYTYGPSVQVVFISAIVYVLISLYSIFKSKRNYRDKRYIPVFIYIVLNIFVAILQQIEPSILMISFTETIVILLMYFTIENPDVRLVEYEKKEKELAVSANEAKTAFLSSMSHEIRTPLNAIVGLSEDMLSYKDKVPSEVQEDCDDIVNASNTLLEIVGNILDISKIEGGKLEIIEADYLPKEEIESLLKIMRTKVEEKDLKFNVYIDPNIPECLLGDRLRIKQIINNFLSNAIKYTEKGSIDFGARWVNNSLELKVRDTGRGIKREDRDKLFEKFERLHVEKTSAVQGTGLGLAITKNLVDLMGGTIKVDSVFGQGSTFDVIIPQKIGNKDNIVREALTVEEKHDVDFIGKKVLIVDDNKLNIKVLRKAIQTFNFEIDECYNGEEALKKIDTNSYDLIFMDIMMPVMGGEEAMGILKQKTDFKTPVLALTADATTGAKERYLSIGFVDYLAKPFSRDMISKKLENVFKDMN